MSWHGHKLDHRKAALKGKGKTIMSCSECGNQSFKYSKKFEAYLCRKCHAENIPMM